MLETPIRRTVSNVQRIEIDVEDAASIGVSIIGGSANAVGVTFFFEGSPDAETKGDSGQWFPLLAMRGASVVTLETNRSGVQINANSNYDQWTVNVATMKRFRVRVSAITSGNFIATIRPSAVPVNFSAAISGTVQVGGVNTTRSGYVTTASTNVNLVGTGVNLYGISISNPTTTAAYLKLYDKATSPVPGTDVPVAIIKIPADSYQQITYPFSGMRMGLGLGFAVTASASGADNAIAGILISFMR